MDGDCVFFLAIGTSCLTLILDLTITTTTKKKERKNHMVSRWMGAEGFIENDELNEFKGVDYKFMAKKEP